MRRARSALGEGTTGLMRLPLIRIDTTTAMYKSLLGIHNAYAIGSPATALVFEYGPPRADKGSLRRLRVDIDAEGRMSGAEVCSRLPSWEEPAITDLASYRFALYSFLTRRMTSRTSFRLTFPLKTYAPSFRRSEHASGADRRSVRVPPRPLSLFDPMLFLSSKLYCLVAATRNSINYFFSLLCSTRVVVMEEKRKRGRSRVDSGESADPLARVLGRALRLSRLPTPFAVRVRCCWAPHPTTAARSTGWALSLARRAQLPSGRVSLLRIRPHCP